jgi:hypothetical protein
VAVSGASSGEGLGEVGGRAPGEAARTAVGHGRRVDVLEVLALVLLHAGAGEPADLGVGGQAAGQADGHDDAAELLGGGELVDPVQPHGQVDQRRDQRDGQQQQPEVDGRQQLVDAELVGQQEGEEHRQGVGDPHQDVVAAVLAADVGGGGGHPGRDQQAAVEGWFQPHRVGQGPPHVARPFRSTIVRRDGRTGRKAHS